MAKFPSYDEMAKDVAEKALDEILYKGKSIREWMKIIIAFDEKQEKSKLYGLEEVIRCAMCTNPIKNDKGCDGGCIVNETMYKKVVKVIEEYIGGVNDE